ncbi:exonuclease domain-containing protein [Bradyrhizobium sp. HKCCYLS2038]|uniref:exonuclease domain-containing protein n=1 Tax=Bradyrhizobium sp. HKCCYLS2038 TaxID=3420764 RepID=UPI003EBDCB71
MTARLARVIDYETTGTPEDEHAEIIEFGRIDVHIASRWIGNPWTSLCRPRGPIPAVTKAVHHITEADVADAPEAREVWGQFWEGLSPGDILVAHNAKFEQHFTPDEGRAWIDTYKVARVVWPDAPTHSNQGLRYWLDLDLDATRATPPHRALPDAYVTAHLFVRLLDLKTADEMVHISKYPALLKIMNFGKHKGMTFEAAPLDYLEWIRDKSDMDEDTKFTARYWVAKRTRQ